jgi:hypothetical protein
LQKHIHKKYPMKQSHISIALIAVAALVLSGLTSKAAVSGPTFSFQENGQGRLELPNGAVIPLPGILTSDPAPGGLLSALAFTTHPQEGAAFTIGDVVLLDAGGGISDVLRFDAATSSATGLTQLIFLYSNDAGGLLADTGLPTAFYVNPAIVPENENAATIFTPIAGQPGFLPNAPVPITYRIFSTPDGGSTLLLFGFAVCGLMAPLLRRKPGVNSAAAAR